MPDTQPDLSALADEIVTNLSLNDSQTLVLEISKRMLQQCEDEEIPHFAFNIATEIREQAISYIDSLTSAG